MFSTRFCRRKLMIMTLTLILMRTVMGPRKRAKVKATWIESLFMLRKVKIFHQSDELHKSSKLHMSM